MAGRKTKLDNGVTKRITDALRAGNTRRAAALYGGITEQTFLNWLAAGEAARSGAFFEFFESVTRAEAECEVENVAVLKRAASGWETKTTRTKTKQYLEAVNGPDGRPLPGPDGQPLTKTVTETETVTVQGREFDWRAALEWLKRRKRADWGDSLDLRRLSDDQLISLLHHDPDTEN
jgi:hypothetical protein